MQGDHQSASNQDNRSLQKRQDGRLAASQCTQRHTPQNGAWGGALRGENPVKQPFFKAEYEAKDRLVADWLKALKYT